MDMYKLFVTIALVCIMAVGVAPSFAADPSDIFGSYYHSLEW